MNKTTQIIIAIVAIVLMGGAVYTTSTLKKDDSHIINEPTTLIDNNPVASPIECPPGYRYWEMTKGCAPTPETNVGWKIYSSSKYGVSFTYPLDWTVKEPNNTEGDVIEIISPETAAWVKAHPNATAVEGISYDIYIGVHGYKQVAYNNTGTQKVKFNGYDAATYSQNVSDHSFVSYIIDKSPRTYVISAFQPLTETKTQILSTIKFTN